MLPIVGNGVMNGEEWLAQRRPDEALLLSASPLPETFDIPVFFEPSDPQAIAQANENAWLVGLVLDGDGPQGREWIEKIRELCHMVEGNTAHFGTSPYYYSFRYWRTWPSRGNEPTAEPDKRRALQYLVYVQGGPDPASRRRTALAMLRQWQAEGTPPLDLARIKPQYFSEDPALLQSPIGSPGMRVLRRSHST